ncbi:hypothetical protein JKF63_04069 [Porcisia hertigi]|uniref:Fe2OG dioxygenase domain-containing protein n=1 Tax=Porcisia hertigi TaxID=2761500 RepID=A0A836LB24_9TRYP|nr:hypothetical protein JKF63_04069 [Porcisia hertigi]
MSFRDHETRLLPPLSLPPRQLKKVRISCKRWLSRFLTTAASAAGIDTHNDDWLGDLAASWFPPLEHATGFVALNGGILAGCTPYDLRQLLETHGLLNCAASADPQQLSHAPPTSTSGMLSPTSPSRCVLEYSSMLPFVLCRKPLRLPAEALQGSGGGGGGGGGASCCGISMMHVPLAELSRFVSSAATASSCPSVADPHNDDAPQDEAVQDVLLGSSSTVNGAGVDTASVKVMVLHVSSPASLWRGGSTSTSSAPMNKGCGFLYLVLCDIAAIRPYFHHLLQRPVIGVERLLLSPPSLWCRDARERRDAAHSSVSTQLSQPLFNGEPLLERRCTSRAVPEVPGLFLVEDFVTAEEEKTIWEELYAGRPQLQLEYLSRRRVAHFNRRFWYGVNTLTDEGVMVNQRPSFYAWMRARLQNDTAAGGVRIDGDYPLHPGDYECDQLTVNYYDYSEMGACGIAAHVDAHGAFDDTVLIVSLGSYTVMEFSRWDCPAGVAAPVGVYLAPRSLAVMTGEARYGWTHCIAEKRTDTLSELLPSFSRGNRISLTWRRGRTQRHTKAGCSFPALCDCDCE